MKVNLTDKMKIIQMRELGIPIKKIAAAFKISRSRVSQIYLYEKEGLKAKIEAEEKWEKLLKEL